MLDLLALGVAADWLYVRLEIHPFLKMLPGTAQRLSFRKIIQMHAILDKVDADKLSSMQEIEEKMRESGRSRR